jgi:tRNA 2-thiouridine synthesizing protein A
MNDNHPEMTLDVSGLLCPLPVLRARKTLAAMTTGHVLCVIATDPMAMIDMPHFCAEQGYQMLLAEKRDDAYFFRIRKAASPA